jgi:propanediol dehydratase large subunit
MASVTITFPANTGSTNQEYETGAQLRHLARQISKLAAGMPDKVSSGASTVLTIDNTASGRSVGSVQITAGPYQTAALRF